MNEIIKTLIILYDLKIITGFNEYIMIEKTLTSLNSDNIKLLQRQKEITRLQSELITEKKMIDAKLDFTKVQTLKEKIRNISKIASTFTMCVTYTTTECSTNPSSNPSN